MPSLRSFNYTNSKGETHWHAVYALSETPDYLMGIDANKALELVVDKYDKDKGPQPHSEWCYNLMSLETEFAADDEPTNIVWRDINLVNLAAAKCVYDTEAPSRDAKHQAYYEPLNNLVLYNKDHSPIDKEKLLKFVKDKNVVNGTDFVNALDEAARWDSDEFYLFALNLCWFTIAPEDKSNVPMPGFFEMIDRHKKMSEVLLLREPTQYKDLKESRAAGKQKIEGFDEEWMKAFKNFKKSGIKVED